MIHDESSFSILADCANGYIGECSCCQRYNFAYKTILIIFNEEELSSFFNWVLTSRFHDDTFWPMPHGRDRVFTSPHSNLYLTFRDLELNELAEMYSKACLVLEARNLVKRN